ncbi:hypothetical protein MHK_004856 [Candidatus Magnetomorum sp. HK-1]|nr:hypothetical protein MHK_004856 [Candidatus Magnetomorum sp. HK-1]
MIKNEFIGKWSIIEMEQWDKDFIDAEMPGYINFGTNEMGEFHFGYVHGFMDCRFSKENGNETVEFSWEGNDEMDQASGRGKATVKNKQLKGHLYFHEGEDSWFKAISI